MNIYIAAPIVGTTDLMKEKIIKVKEKLKSNVLKEDDVFLYDPMEHGVPNAWGMEMKEWARCIFTLDVVAIDNSDWVVICDFGRKNTGGTTWECGYAFGKGKKIFLIQMSDDEIDYSVMTYGCSANYCMYKDFIKTDEEDIIEKYFHDKGKEKNGCILN